MTQIPEIGGGQRNSDPWYYFKKSLPLYPGIDRYKCAEFLDEYYAWRRERQTIFHKVRNGITYPVFKAWLYVRVGQVARRYNLDKEWAQNALGVASRNFIDPNDLAWFRVNTDADAKHLFRRFEYASVNKLINPKNWSAECVLGNKIAFHNICKAHNIPHPQILATAIGGQVEVFKKPEHGVIAIKPSGGEGGRGFSSAKIDLSAANWREEMIRIIQAQTDNRSSGWLVQDKLRNHPALKPLSQSAVITARYVTMLNEQDAPELVAAVLRFPSDPKIEVDNLKAGAMMAKINVGAEKLEKGCLGRGAHDIEKHPVSGAKIAGFEVPFAKESAELVTVAHEQFRDYCLVGWDVLITPNGPIILEGNGKPGIDITQRGMWQNAGEGRFGELISFHVHKALSKQ